MKKILINITLLCTVSLVLIPDVLAQFYESTIGSLPLAVDQFRAVDDVAVDASGNIYAVDPNSHQVKKFSSTGVPIFQWGSFGFGDSQFITPQGIDVDVDGNVYVVDTYNHRIQKFSSTGTFITKWGSYGVDDSKFNAPRGIAIDGSNNVYVVDVNNNRIQKFSSTGAFISKWGVLGSGDSQFNNPQSIAIDVSGNVYVVDANNRRIQKFSSTGTFLGKWGSSGSGDGQFIFPLGIAIDASGNVYVSDINIHRIQKFSSTGTFLTKWGSYGSGNGLFRSPRGMTFDVSGSIYVADSENSRIQKFSNIGVFQSKWGNFGPDGLINTPHGIAIDSNGNIYVADTNYNRIQKFSSTGAFLTKWGSQGSGDGQFNSPQSIAIDAGGNVYVVDTYNYRIQKFSNTGAFLAKWGIYGSGDGQLNAPQGIAIDASGNVYVVDTNNNRVQKFSSAGIFLDKWGSQGSGDGQFNFPAGISIDLSGNLYIVDSGNNRIQKFSGTGIGNFITKWGSFGSGDGQFNNPRNITIDAVGNAYVSDSSNDRIQQFSSIGIGTFLTKWGSYGSGNNQLKYPLGIATDGSGNVYLADANNHQIQKFSILKVTTLSSSSGLEDAALTITGTGFSSIPTENSVKFNGVAGVVTSASSTSLVAKVPAGATTGPISVSRQGLTSQSTGEFLVLPLSIASFTPSIGAAGTVVTITGRGFSSVNANNLVKFNGITASVMNSTPTSITVSVPVGMTVGKVTVTVNNTTATSTDDFGGTLEISSFNPASAESGTPVTISGTGFSTTLSNQTVKFNNTTAIVTESSLTSLTVTVPAGGSTGKISVTRETTTVESESEFVVLPLSISSFSPGIATVSESITISGTGFSSVNANNIVKFNEAIATVTNSTPTSITVNVPSGATDGKIKVTVNEITATSANDFKITKLKISNASYPEFYIVGDAGVSVSIPVNDINEVGNVTFRSRGITAGETSVRTEAVTVSTISNTIVYQIPSSHFTDPLGLYSWFSISDKVGNELLTEPKHTYLFYSANTNAQEIPNLKFGKKASSYNLIAVPLNLNEPNITKVFKDLGAYDDRKWRLYGFTNGAPEEQPASIYPGNGYWLIMAKENKILTGAGSTLKVTADKPHTIKLLPGWNLIGNPYDFSISWTDVLEHNNLTPELLKIRQFIDGAVVSDPLINRYRGAFINSDVARDIEIPLINRSLSSGRIANERKPSIDADNWMATISLDDGEIRNDLFGFGMNISAKESKDVYDEPTLPLLKGMSSFDLKFREIGSEALATDIVTTSENYSWQANIHAEKDLIITWDNSFFGNNIKQLIIENLNEVETIDMRISTQMKLRAGSHVLKFHYGDINYVKERLIEKSSRIGYVYPNPIDRSKGIVSVAVSLPEGRNEVSWQLENLLGNDLQSSKVEMYEGGRQNITWHADFDQFPAGLYLVRLEVKDATGSTKQIHQRIILR